jgi:hypothetical protein
VLFPNLAPGLHSFRLADESGGGGPMFSMGDAMFVSGLEGGGGDEWSQVQVGDGERGELTLRAAPRASLTGRVREAGKVLAGATLRLEKAGEGEGGVLFPGMGGGGRRRTATARGASPSTT